MSSCPKTHRDHPGSAKAGVTLVELLIVIGVLGILAGIAVTRYDPGVVDQLQAAAQVVAADVNYCRSLAVGNGSKYRIDFDAVNHRYTIEHSGTNAALDDLPTSPFRQSSDPATRQTTDLTRLPLLTTNIELAAIRKVGNSTQESVDHLEFDSLGALTQIEQAVLWLKAAAGTTPNYISIRIDPVTGITEIGEVQTTPPPATTSVAN